MARAVNMTVVTSVCLILNVGGVDRDTAGFFFRCLVDFGVIRKLGATLVGENLGDSSSEGRLSVVNVTLGCARK
jgi:hypothetical protein